MSKIFRDILLGLLRGSVRLFCPCLMVCFFVLFFFFNSILSLQVLFWSGVFSLAHEYGNYGRRYVTLEDTLIGYLANSITWCGQSIDPGYNVTRCPAWDDCPLEAAESFWAGASMTVFDSSE